MSWFRRLWNGLRHKRSPPRFRTARVEDLPEVLSKRTIYLVGEGKHLWSVGFLCPCGCGDAVQLNTLVGARPCWRASIHKDDTVTLRPSVWRRVGCRSHFFVRRSRVEWVTQDEAH